METAREKPAFKEAFTKRRCLIPADGFYEWNRRVTKIQRTVGEPCFFQMKNASPFAMAGLWEEWEDPMAGGKIETCSILTTRANDLVAPHHDRMPVIVPEGDYAHWLEGAIDSGDFLRLLEPKNPTQMEVKVSLLSEAPLELDLG
jgi:putative SOS response-associated peptidase YedK